MGLSLLRIRALNIIKKWVSIFCIGDGRVLLVES